MLDPAALVPLLVVIACGLLLGPLLEREPLGRRLVAGAAMLFLVRYLVWRVPACLPTLAGGGAQAWWAALCLAVEVPLVLDGLLGFWVLAHRRDRSAEADRHERRLRALPPEALPTVDLLIPTYNEEADVLERTIVGAAAVDYPHLRVWVLDDGRRDWVAELCRRKGVGYLTRPDNRHAKAGNINHALQCTDGEFVAVFDADFVPRHDFLWRTLGFFADPGVGIVQTPQHFFNPDPVQLNLGAERWLPEEQRFFFTVLQPSRDAFDAAFCCGSNAVIRRTALERAGGFPTGSVTEDVLLTLVLLRFGQVTRYLNERLAVGLSPETTQAYFVQRRRWCRGGVQLLFLKDGPLGPGLGWRHRLLFLPTYWLLQLPSKLFLVAVPLVFLWTGLVPLHLSGLEEFLLYPLTTMVVCSGAMMRLAPGAHLPLVTDAIQLFMALRLAPTALASLIKPFGTPFRVTPKGRAAGEAVFDRGNFLATGLLLGLTLLGLLKGQAAWPGNPGTVEQQALGGLWAVVDAVVLLLVMGMSFAAPRQRGQERFPWQVPARLRRLATDGDDLPWLDAQTINVSLSGAALTLADAGLAAHDLVELELPGPGRVRAVVVRAATDGLSLQFDPLTEHQNDALIRALYTSGLVNGCDGRIPARRLTGILLRRLFASG